MKVQIRIERDKSHFVKKSFDGIEAAIAFLDAVMREKTKRQLLEWLRFKEISDFDESANGSGKSKRNLSLMCKTSTDISEGKKN